MKKLYASALLVAALAAPTFQAQANPIEGNKMVQLHAREKSSTREANRIEVAESVFLGEAVNDKNGVTWISDTESFTVGGWFKIDQTGNLDGSNTRATVMQHHAEEHCNFNGSFVMGVDPDGSIVFSDASNTNGTSGLNYKEGEGESTLTRGAAHVEFGTWTNLAFSVNAADSTYNLYQDGKLICQSKYSGTFKWLPDVPSVFGFGANGFEGQIDQLYFYRTALDATSAAKAMTDATTAVDASLIAAVYDFSNMADDYTFAPVAGVREETAAFGILTGAAGGDGVTGGTWAVKEPELLESTRDAQQGYAATSGVSGNGNRNYPTIRISSGAGFTDIPGVTEKSGYTIYQDRTEYVVNVAPGEKMTLEFPESVTEWMHPYVYIDRDNDGAFQSAWDAENNVPVEGCDLVAYYYRPDEAAGLFYSNDSDPSTDGHLSLGLLKKEFQLPAELVAGQTVRCRVKSDWNNIDPFGCQDSNNRIENNGGLILDFMIKIGLPDTVRVSADPAEAGIVYIDVEGVTEAYPSRGANVKLVAKPANEDYEFVNWTTVDGTEVSDEATVSVPVEGNADYVAHFNKLPERFTINFTGENVTVKITQNGMALTNGSRVFSGETVVVELETEGAYVVNGFTVNGVDKLAEYLENGSYTTVVEENMTFAATAEEVVPHLHLNVSDNGTAKLWYYPGDDDSQDEVVVADGDALPVNCTLYGFFAPNDGHELSLNINGMNREDLVGEGTLVEEDGAYYLYYFLTTDDVNMEVGFVDASVELVGADNNGAVRYFNLQGMEVKAENLTNGIYVVRSADKAEKVYIRK